MKMSTLAKDLKQLIALRVDLLNLPELCLVDKGFGSICASENYWLLKFEHDFPNEKTKPEQVSWRQWYAPVYILNKKYRMHVRPDNKLNFDVLVRIIKLLDLYWHLYQSYPTGPLQFTSYVVTQIALLPYGDRVILGAIDFKYMSKILVLIEKSTNFKGALISICEKLNQPWKTGKYQLIFEFLSLGLDIYTTMVYELITYGDLLDEKTTPLLFQILLKIDNPKKSYPLSALIKQIRVNSLTYNSYMNYISAEEQVTIRAYLDETLTPLYDIFETFMK